MDEHKSVSDALDIIEEKLNRLRRLDRNYSVFGSSEHRYRLNPTKPADDIKAFEAKHKISLPFDYRCFIRFVGDGGAGPFYGVGHLEDGIFDDMDYKDGRFVIDLSKPFPYTQSWNIDPSSFQSYREYCDCYYAQSHINGLLRICNFGCGVFISLVVNGPEHGKVWTDDRSSDYGIHPSRELGNEAPLTFLEWYERWLDNSLAAFEKN